MLKRSTLALALFTVTMMAAGAAEARTDLPNPFAGDPGVTVFVGEDQATTNQIVVWFNHSNNRCFVDQVGQTSGLWGDYMVTGSSRDDVLQIVQTWGINLSCQTITGQNLSFTLNPLIYGSHYFDLAGLASNDALFGGPGDTWLFGDAGNDALYGYSPIGVLLGQDDNDSLYGYAGNTDHLEGGPGNDCLFDQNNAVSVFDCGPGDDRWAGAQPPPGMISCDARSRKGTACGPWPGYM